MKDDFNDLRRSVRAFDIAIGQCDKSLVVLWERIRELLSAHDYYRGQLLAREEDDKERARLHAFRNAVVVALNESETIDD